MNFLIVKIAHHLMFQSRDSLKERQCQLEDLGKQLEDMTTHYQTEVSMHTSVLAYSRGLI